MWITIFEIGGRDSEFIRLENGAVVDFAMKRSCAAEYGFLVPGRAGRKAQCKSSRVNSAKKALSSCCPSQVGERCTVF